MSKEVVKMSWKEFLTTRNISHLSWNSIEELNVVKTNSDWYIAKIPIWDILDIPEFKYKYNKERDSITVYWGPPIEVINLDDIPNIYIKIHKRLGTDYRYHCDGRFYLF